MIDFWVCWRPSSWINIKTEIRSISNHLPIKPQLCSRLARGVALPHSDFSAYKYPRLATPRPLFPIARMELNLPPMSHRCCHLRVMVTPRWASLSPVASVWREARVRGPLVELEMLSKTRVSASLLLDTSISLTWSKTHTGEFPASLRSHRRKRFRIPSLIAWVQLSSASSPMVPPLEVVRHLHRRWASPHHSSQKQRPRLDLEYPFVFRKPQFSISQPMAKSSIRDSMIHV
jgi:hypothetical protein